MASDPAQIKVTAPSLAPTNKAVAATGGSAIGAALSTLVLYGFDPHQHLPAAVATAITTLVTACVTLAAAYFTPPGGNESVVMTEKGLRSARSLA